MSHDKAGPIAPESRIVPCPDCHHVCGWCSWFRKNARAIGCGATGKHKCDYGSSLKGTTCPTCGGTEKVRATTTYARVEEIANG